MAEEARETVHKAERRVESLMMPCVDKQTRQIGRVVDQSKVLHIYDGERSVVNHP